ncbi:UNVERIFIED_ORG: hypothetical protein ABIC54_006659 [Burkholderia sp. 1263]
MERYIEAGCNKDVGDSSAEVGTATFLTFEPPLPMTRQARPDAEIAGHPDSRTIQFSAFATQAGAQLICFTREGHYQNPGIGCYCIRNGLLISACDCPFMARPTTVSWVGHTQAALAHLQRSAARVSIVQRLTHNRLTAIHCRLYSTARCLVMGLGLLHVCNKSCTAAVRSNIPPATSDNTLVFPVAIGFRRERRERSLELLAKLCTLAGK